MRSRGWWIEVVNLSESNVEEMLILLRELVKWSKFESIPKLRTVLEQNLTNDKEKIIYEFSNGERSTRDVAKVADVSHVTVQNYWEKWSKLGIVDKSEKYEGRYRHICSLEEVGLTVPEVKDIVQHGDKEADVSVARE
jgi:transcription initiation factor TFIIIB Brf1 subunit/transcription initiation factor TFIIB